MRIPASRCPICQTAKRHDQGVCRSCFAKLPPYLRRQIYAAMPDNRAEWLQAFRILVRQSKPRVEVPE